MFLCEHALPFSLELTFSPQVVKEKGKLEYEMEAEQEFLSLRLQKRIAELEAQKQFSQLTVHSLSVSHCIVAQLLA